MAEEQKYYNEQGVAVPASQLSPAEQASYGVGDAGVTDTVKADSAQGLLQKYITTPGLATSASEGIIGNLIKQEQASRKEQVAGIETGFGEREKAREALGAKQVGRGKAVAYREMGGVEVGSVELSYITSIEDKIETDLKSLEVAKQEAIRTANRESMRVIGEMQMNLLGMKQDALKMRLGLAGDMVARAQQQAQYKTTTGFATREEERGIMEKKIEDLATANITEYGKLLSDKPILVLPNGQKISPDDPNYKIYKKQEGVTEEKADIEDWIDKLAKENKVDRDSLEAALVNVQKELGLAGFEGLTSDQALQAGSLAVQIFGKRAGVKPENVKKITDLMKQGKTMDEIQDMLKYAGQSEKFAGDYRDAAESIGYKLSKEKREALYDSTDRYLERGDPTGAFNLLKKSAIDSVGVEESRGMRGKTRTLEFVSEIGDDLKEYERKGGKTNIFKGLTEKILGRAGQVQEDALRKIATKIALAIQNYRKSMSGVAFSVPESKEYLRVFPDIKNVGELNAALVEGLEETFRGDLDYFYESQMGSAYTVLRDEIEPAVEPAEIEIKPAEKSITEKVKEAITGGPDLSKIDYGFK